MIIMKKSIRRLLITAASLTLVGTPGLTTLSASAQEGTIATVNGTEITAADLYEDMKEQYGLTALRAMIIEEVLKANVKDVEAIQKQADEEVQTQIDELGGEEMFNQFLAYQKLGTIEQYKYQIFIRDMLQELVEARLEITDEVIQEYYENDYQPNMEAQHILVDTEEEAKQVIERINNGEEFDAVAKEVSKDGSASNGGLLSPFTTGQMVPEFEEAVKSLKNGEMTQEPVKSEFGYHVIKTLNNGEKQPLDKIHDQVVEAYKQSKFSDSDFTHKIVGQLIKEADVKINDKDLNAAVEDLIALAEQKDEPKEAAEEEKDQAQEGEGEQAETSAEEQADQETEPAE